MNNMLNKIIPPRIMHKLCKKLIGSNGDYMLIKGATYKKDGLITFHNSDFLKDPLFMQAYQLGKATGSWGESDLEWRAYVICWAANKGKNLEGDFVECGVNKGGYARAAMHYIDFKNIGDRRYYLLDTYRGFPEKYRHLAAEANLNDYSECYEAVVETFREFQNAVIIKGMVPDTLSQVKAKKVCFLSIDMNCADPEIAAAEFFWDKLVSGAVIVLDDYCYSDAYRRGKEAFDDFAKRKNVQILQLPTGQGLIFKP